MDIDTRLDLLTNMCRLYSFKDVGTLYRSRMLWDVTSSFWMEVTSAEASESVIKF